MKNKQIFKIWLQNYLNSKNFQFGKLSYMYCKCSTNFNERRNKNKFENKKIE